MLPCGWNTDGTAGADLQAVGPDPAIIGAAKIPCLPGVIVYGKEHGILTAAEPHTSHPHIIRAGLGKVHQVFLDLIRRS